MSTSFLRVAKIEDAETLTALALRSKAYWGYDADFMAACAAELTITPERIRNEHIAVAVSEDTITGLVALARGDEDRVLELEDMFVDPAHIGTGLGRLLMAHAEMRAKKSGACRVEVDADPHAQGFYERCGYRLIGRSPSASILGRTLPRLALDL